MTDTRRNALISALILANRAKGMSMKDAFDAVLGVGQYDKVVSEVYTKLRAEQGLT